MIPEGLHENQGAVAVDLEIQYRVSHRIDMVDLTRQVKDDVLVFNQMIHGELVSHVTEVYSHLVFYRIDIEEISALSWKHVVDNGNVRPKFDQFYCEVRTDKTETARYENVLSRVILPMIHAFHLYSCPVPSP